MMPHALTDELAAILRTVAVTDFCEPSTIAKVHGGSVAEQLNELHAQGLVIRQAARRPDRTRTTLYSISFSGRERLRDHEANLCVRVAPKSEPVPAVGIAAPRIAHLTVAGMYDGAELRPFEGRPGAMDAFALPSRMGNHRHYRDGRVERTGTAAPAAGTDALDAPFALSPVSMFHGSPDCAGFAHPLGGRTEIEA